VVAALTDSFDLDALRLLPGEGRSLELDVTLAPLELGGEPYAFVPDRVTTRVDVSRMAGSGWALRLRLCATLEGSCMRCLGAASQEFAVDACEIDQPGGGEELESPYVEDGTLDLAAWARDAIVLDLPAAILCRADCLGLCPECAIDLNTAGAEHHHEREPDPRWAKLAELQLED
jgi:uncharacterized protein